MNQTNGETTPESAATSVCRANVGILKIIYSRRFEEAPICVLCHDLLFYCERFGDNKTEKLVVALTGKAISSSDTASSAGEYWKIALAEAFPMEPSTRTKNRAVDSEMSSLRWWRRGQRRLNRRWRSGLD
ncbi:hypothetical protein RHMOL_Rhmol13G0214700 [Rhododendron molle]|uniref:Uncharacterized protein n=1 Tax=Rhododendron molle TaxID=49168 RepID=A0ACC0L9M6_RHOML|nr:hypothetical protein RHMOL_Rhmol13G0214700 [Rhododendron molle]